MIKNKLLKFSLLLLFAIICIFIGHEYPSIIEIPKKNIKFVLKKVGLKDSFIVTKKDLQIANQDKKIDITEKKTIIEGNSYDLNYSKVLNFDGRTAGLFIENQSNGKQDFNIFLQDGINIKNDSSQEINLPLDIFMKKNGGVKAVLKIESEYYALVSNKDNLNCYYASIVNLKDTKKIFSTKCLPDIERIDFNGIGGAYSEKDSYIFLSIGAPEWDSETIRKLAQNTSSNYGKIIKFKKDSFKKDQILKEDYKIFSLGHKNPQGMTINKNKIFSVEHGPQGGDEINLIEENKNYGWPVISYGTRYNDGKSFKKKFNEMESPLFSFLPSIAPSAMSNCPDNLKQFYSNHSCLLILSLRAMSMFVVLIDEKKTNIISVERFKFGQRLRHFGLNKNNKMFLKDNFFFITADGFGVIKVEFNNFR